MRLSSSTMMLANGHSTNAVRASELMLLRRSWAYLVELGRPRGTWVNPDSDTSIYVNRVDWNCTQYSDKSTLSRFQFVWIRVITGPPTRSVRKGRLVTLSGVCRRLSFVVVCMGALKTEDQKMQEMKIQDQMSPHENAGHELSIVVQQMLYNNPQQIRSGGLWTYTCFSVEF